MSKLHIPINVCCCKHDMTMFVAKLRCSLTMQLKDEPPPLGLLEKSISAWHVVLCPQQLNPNPTPNNRVPYDLRNASTNDRGIPSLAQCERTR